MAIVRRGSNFHLRRRVPLRYRRVEPRVTVWISLHTDSETVAKQKAPLAWQHHVEAWEARMAGDTGNAERRFETARELAAVRGYRYLPAGQVAALPRDELLARVEAIPVRNDKPDMVEATAVLGGASEPPITVSRALELFGTLTGDQVIGKSEDQVRRWKNPRKKAVANFIAVVGDKVLADISGDDMLDFRQWWTEKLESEDLTPNSANKDLIHLGSVLKTINKRKRLGLVLPLTDLSFRGGENRQRPPFSVEWIKTKLLAPRALDGLNTEARCIVLGMVNTGYRPSEGAALGRDQIRLEGKVPHISIEPVGRQLKSAHARRVIPLAGVSLEAFRQCPDGFPRYADNPSLSATVNKFLRANGLLETPRHSFYSLRHSFEDRMLAAGIDDRIRRDLFGHRLDRERYGKGASLEHMVELVARIAF
jgi:integrase